METTASKVYRLARGVRNYANPIALAWQKLAVHADPIEITDRAAGLSFLARPKAFQMFGEVFHLHLYDIPWVPIRAGDTVIDVGANHGFFSLYAASQGATVYAFEPQRDTFELLKQNIRRNGLEDRVIPFCCAIAGAKGTSTLAITEELAGGMSSINPTFTKASGAKVIDSYDVETISLAGLIEEKAIKRIRILKLDCEGSELMILRSLSPEQWRVIEGIAAEAHPEAYPSTELFATIQQSGLYQIGTLDTVRHYGIGSDIFHCAQSEVVMNALGKGNAIGKDS
ncbi:FkbM family methyltransferase [Synechococcus sp. ATX 2A4]|nr:FkbM family methyltransferase [Synechococcus sp. ATX 2A4]